MRQLRYVTEDDSIVTVLVGTNSETGASEMVKRSDSRFYREIDNVLIPDDEIYFISHKKTMVQK